jgi:hypothetical protein
VPHSTLLAQTKDDPGDCVIIPDSNAIKPTLDEHQNFARVLYAITNLNLSKLKNTMTIMIPFILIEK